MTTQKDEQSISEESHSENSETQQSSGVESDNENSGAFKASLAKKESEAVFRLRLLVISILFLAAIAVCLVVYYITLSGETEEFESQYDGTAEKVIDSFEGILERIGSISSVGVAATIHGLDRAHEPWPFVTLSSFQQRSSTARLLSGALYLRLNPLVTEEDRDRWETYVVGQNKYWIAEGIEYQEEAGLNEFEQNKKPMDEVTMANISRKNIFYYNDQEEEVFEAGPGPYLPSWQTSPVLYNKAVNENFFRRPNSAEDIRQCVEDREVLFGNFETAPSGLPGHPNATTDFFATILSIEEKKFEKYLGDPMARVFIPVYNSFENDKKVVAVMMALVHWKRYFRKILPKNIQGVTVVLENTCNGKYTYEINGAEADVVGFGDHHEAQFEKYKKIGFFSKTVKIADGTQQGLPVDTDGCQYQLRVYPSEKFASMYYTNTPILITFSVAMVFLFAILMFVFYDRLVERRQRIVLTKAAHSTAIVSSLFPKQVRDRLLAEGDLNEKKGDNLAASHRLKSYLKDGNDNGGKADSGSSQIADLFPQCTVLFADIAGFTAWSSTREPEQVFVLLQSIYQTFDKVAKRRRVFKVETIGDCYLAVTGLPDPQSKHAIIMARFAWECRLKMRDLTRDLESTLGPDTGDLAMRVGMHSGPVTAGVLRGDRARFQLFGDTVNTAARMESTGVRDKIQVSQSTADILTECGKAHWLRPRKDSVEAKGKGVMQTYWLNPGVNSPAASTSSSDVGSNSDGGQTSVNSESFEIKQTKNLVKQGRLVDWMVELLLEHIRKIAAKRKRSSVMNGNMSLVYHPASGKTCLDEVQEVIHMADFNAIEAKETECWRELEIEQEIVLALREYVTIIAESYRQNPFHNFEHACHVTMSVNKLLKRIVAPELSDSDLKLAKEKDCLPTFIYNHTYGISGDPLALLAIVFSALIHDVDHRGVSNLQLMKEEPQMGTRYGGKSVAEQNSLDLAWDLFMTERFQNLRRFIFANQDELWRFRQLIVNTVLATDIFDKELNVLRKDRWQKAFSKPDSNKDDRDRKATIVIEHIIQASDVSHTMQHWHVYRKWNMRLFKEMCLAHQAGRMGADPKSFWYKGELGFFDNYVIPLAKKLKDCNVFGVSSDEYLNYAVSNRAEWAQKGEGIVEEIISELCLDTANEE